MTPETASALVAKLLARARDGSLSPSENARALDALRNLRAEHFPLVLKALEDLLERMEGERQVVARGGMSASVSDFMGSIFVKNAESAVAAVRDAARKART